MAIRAYPLILIRFGLSMYSSSERSARSAVVCGVRDVDVRDAAALPVVWRAALYGTFRELFPDGVAAGLVKDVEDAFDPGREGLWLGSEDFAARALATAAFAARIFADEPIVERFILLKGSARSASCSSVKVDVPSFRYLKEFISLFPRLCGSCKVMISFLLNSSSLTKSLQCFGLMFNRSIVSHANTFPLALIATMCVLSVKAFIVTGSQCSPSSFFCM